MELSEHLEGVSSGLFVGPWQFAFGAGPVTFSVNRGYLNLRLGHPREGVEARELYWVWGGPERREFWCTLFQRRRRRRKAVIEA